MGGAETIAGGRRGPGRLKLLITAPGSARMGAEACFSVWSFFPALPLPKLHLSGNALSQILGLEPLQDAGVETAAKEQFSAVFMGESEEVRTYPCL